MKSFLFSLLFLTAIFSRQGFAQLTVTGSTAIQAVDSLLGPGVHVSNVTYNGIPNSLAIFNGTSSLAISNGIYIGTGTSSGIENGASFFQSDAAAGPGDTDLQAISNGATQDAGVLEFDFKVAGDSVKFNFVFASEEYNEYVNSSFNDVFGFFISGPGITGTQNIALIPGTTTPVTINNVNNGNSPSGTLPTGPCTNCAFYTDNTFGTTVVFDGHTTVLTAIAAVQPCTYYHIKLAVANVGDGAFDSGVFLEANSFQPCGPITVFNGLAPLGDTLTICNGTTVLLSACQAPNYLWNNGDTTQSITVTQPGIYNVSVSSGNCFAASGQIVVVSDTSFVQPLLSQNGNTLSSSITNPAFIYEWFKDGIPVPNSNTPNLQFASGGCYKVLITDISGCTQLSDSICLTFAGMESPVQPDLKFTLLPNPASENINLNFSNPAHDQCIIRINDMAGKLYLELNTANNRVLIVNPDLPKGVYIVELENTRTGEKARKKLIRE